MSRTLLLQCWLVVAPCVTFTSAGCGLAPRTWRLDGRCGVNFALENGDLSTCDRRSERPCCSDFGYCGNTDSHCRCEGCVDYREIFQGCVQQYSGLEGVIESHEHPAPYPPSYECCYDIQRPDESYCGVKLYFDHFDVEGSMEPFCQQDWLTAEYCVPEKGARMCGNLTGTVHEFLYQPGSSALRLSFRSDSHNLRHNGFHIRYELLQSCRAPYANPMATEIPGAGGALCYTKVTNHKGTINTPYFPSNYPNEVDCVYEFERFNSSICGVRMRSRVFELQEPFKSPFGGACTDFFHCPGCGYLCGSVEYAWVARFQPDATAIKFHFHSDEADTSKGFMATFEQIYDCD